MIYRWLNQGSLHIILDPHLLLLSDWLSPIQQDQLNSKWKEAKILRTYNFTLK